MNAVRHGLCIGGPRSGQTLATLAPGVVRHPGDAGGYYVFKGPVGPTPAKWLWIKQEKNNADKQSS